MSNSTAKPPLKDPTRIPSATDVDEHLYQFSRYARVVRGAARVAGLSTRLAWSAQGWVEQFRLDEAVLGSINLVRVPPVASIAVSRALEEALAQRVIPEPVRQVIAAAEGRQVKWVEAELTGPIPGETMASLITIKAELIKAGLVPITAAERPRAVQRPEPEPVKPVRAAKPSAEPSKPSKPVAKPPAKPSAKAPKAAAKKPTKAKKPAVKKRAARAQAKKPAAKKPAKRR